MADTKISGLTAFSTFASGDLIPIVDVSDTTMAATGTDKKLTVTVLTGYLDTLYQAVNTVTAANEASDTTCFPLFVTAATGSLGPKTNAGLAFNSATGALNGLVFTGVSPGIILSGQDGASLSIGDGIDVVFTSNSTIDQSLAVASSPTFAGLTLGARTLTLGGNFTTSAAFTTTGTSGITLAAPSTGSPIIYTLPSVAASLAPLASPTFTGQIIAPAGSVGTPSVGSVAATNTGIYFPFGTQVAATIAGVQTFVTGVSYAQVPSNAGTFILGATGDVAISRISANVLGIATSFAGGAGGSLNLTNLTASGNVIIAQQTPASASATGTANTITFDASFIYICTATNTWKRVAIATW